MAIFDKDCGIVLSFEDKKILKEIQADLIKPKDKRDIPLMAKKFLAIADDINSLRF